MYKQAVKELAVKRGEKLATGMEDYWEADTVLPLENWQCHEEREVATGMEGSNH